MNTEIVTNVTIANLGLPELANPLPLSNRSVAELKGEFATGGRNPTDMLPRDEVAAEIASRLADLKKLAKTLATEIELHEATLMEAIGNHYGIEKVAVWRYQTGGTYIDMAALTKELGEEFVAKFTLRRSGFRVLALK